MSKPQPRARRSRYAGLAFLRKTRALGAKLPSLILAASVIIILCRAELLAKSPHHGLRALAVIEFRAPAAFSDKGQLSTEIGRNKDARLFPITVLQDDVYFDGTLYQATPVPMMLQPGIIYDVQRSGDSLGSFTVKDASKFHDDWVASGAWKPQAANASGNGPTPTKTAAAASMERDDERPTLRRTPESQAASANAAPAPANRSDVYATPPEPKRIPAQAPDPDRPTLRRGRPAGDGDEHPTQEAKTKTAGSTTARPGNTPSHPAIGRQSQFLVAISDPSSYETRPYTLQWKAEEKIKLTKNLEAIAREEAQKYVRGLSGKWQAVSGLQNVDVHAFDLFLNNDVELVLTARQSWGEPRGGVPVARHSTHTTLRTDHRLNVLITVVAFWDSVSPMRKLFSNVTDEDRLDEIGRLDFVDAVDADGDGNGELLFRRSDDANQSFELYRVGRDQLWKLFEGAQSSL
jgi:hypothetical protein